MAVTTLTGPSGQTSDPNGASLHSARELKLGIHHVDPSFTSWKPLVYAGVPAADFLCVRVRPCIFWGVAAPLTFKCLQHIPNIGEL